MNDTAEPQEEPQPAALDIEGLTKTYPQFALDKVSLTLPMGYIMGFVGQNGAGKTTTIRLILNMANRDAGAIRVFGLDNTRDEMKVKQTIAAVFDEIFFVDSWRVREVEAALRGFYSAWDAPAFASYLRQFDVQPDKRVKDLSRGMKMKLMLAVAMSHGARLLVLDEPTSGLDPLARDELLDILQAYIADGDKSVFFSTHITTDLERIADYITLIEAGKVLYTGTKDGLLEHFTLVSGAVEDLTEALRASLIGLTQTRTGFTALALTQTIKTLPATMSAEEPTIDDVIIHVGKDGGRHGTDH
jgi:ABC-2 type transport system ATP-binding protein